MQLVRNFVRWAFLVLALGYVLWVEPVMSRNFQEWRASVPSDPVGAAFWRSAFYLDVTEVLAVLAMGVAVWFLLKSRKKEESGRMPN